MLDALGDKFASGEGIIDALNNTGAMLFQNDEFDGVLRQLKSDKDSKMESIPSMLLSLYTSANTKYSVRVRSGGKMRHIDQPHLTIFGTATPSGFYDALSQRMLTGGLFARMLIFDVEARGHGQNQGKITDMSDSIINQAWYWNRFSPSVKKNDDWRDNSVNGHEVYDIPVLPEMLPKIDYIRKIMNTQYDNAIAKSDEVAATSWSRYLENAIKLAMLYACSRDNQDPIIDNNALGWGAVFMSHQISRQLQMTKSYNSVSPFHADCQKFLRLLKKAKSQKISRSKLLRDMRCRAYDFNQIVETLSQRKEIVVQRTQEKTKPTIFYKLNKKGSKR